MTLQILLFITISRSNSSVIIYYIEHMYVVGLTVSCFYYYVVKSVTTESTTSIYHIFIFRFIHMKPKLNFISELSNPLLLKEVNFFQWLMDQIIRNLSMITSSSCFYEQDYLEY